VVTASEPLALAFSTVLERRAGLTVVPVPRNPMQVAELVASAHVSAITIEPYVVFIESDECKDAEDATWRAVEMANAIPLDTAGDWRAAHDPQKAST
jgi:hypothetical protein